MRDRGRKIAAALLLGTWLALPSPAQASASLACNIDDKVVKLAVEGAFGRGAGESVINFGGRIEVLAKATPEDFRSVALEREHLTQGWLYRDDVKLRIFRERPGNAGLYGSVELVIETKRFGPRDEGTYAGTYQLFVHHLTSETDSDGKRFTARGKATCSVG